VDIGVARSGGGRDVRFLNTLSIGLYPELVGQRERLAERWGKWPGAAVALLRVLRTATPIELSVNGRPRRLWLLFVGNGRYVPEGFAPAFRPRLDDALLDLRLVDGDHTLARTRVIASALVGGLRRSRVYSAEQVPWVQLEGLTGADTLAYDGEVVPTPDRLRLEKEDRALIVYRPAVTQNEPAQQGRLAAGTARYRGRMRGRRLPADGGPSA
jgi:diacylglycerol kinase family enzyme